MPIAINPVDGVRIHYEVEGNGSPLLLYPGLTMTIDAWRDFGYVDALRASNSLIMLDPRGHGRSDTPHDQEQYTLERMASDALAVLDNLAVERAHYFGYSMGASIGYVAVHAAPQRFLSFIAGAGPIRTPSAIFGPLRPVLEQGPQALAFVMDQPAGSLLESRRTALLATDTEALLAIIEAHGEQWSVECQLPEIEAPALVYAGENDRVYADARRAAELMPNARFLSLPGLDHLQALGRSAAVLPQLAAFLDGA